MNFITVASNIFKLRIQKKSSFLAYHRVTHAHHTTKNGAADLDILSPEDIFLIVFILHHQSHSNK